MFQQSLQDLAHGFSVALAPTNLLWSVVGVLVGNLVGVLPGMGVLTAISILLPLTYSMQPVAAILMLSGIFYGSQYGGAIGAILLNLPSHPPHAVTCLDGYPLTRAGRGGAALGITMLSSFFAASFGILVMIVASPLLVEIAFDFGPAEICSVMFLGLVAGSTLTRASPLKGIAMTTLGLVLGTVGTDVNSGVTRFGFGVPELANRLELVAVAMGLFGVADFIVTANTKDRVAPAKSISLRDMRPTASELRQAFWPMVRGTLVGTAFGALPGTGPTITTFIAYALERRISRRPERFGQGAIEGVASPEAASHSKTQVDFIPTLTLGIPGDAVMALLLGALLVHGIQPGPQLISEHPDLFWGLIASFWIGNLLLVVLNVPLIAIWVRMLLIPYRFLFPSALFFIGIGVYSANNSTFEVLEVVVFGLVGALLISLRFPVASILLGFVLGPILEENLRRALVISRGSLATFVDSPIRAFFVGLAILILALQLTGRATSIRRRNSPDIPRTPGAPVLED